MSGMVEKTKVINLLLDLRHSLSDGEINEYAAYRDNPLDVCAHVMQELDLILKEI